ncbi:MAG: hypothetical protein AAF414_08550 [Pseudomonadota bacterium]
MNGEHDAQSTGLAWPDAYASLLPAIRDEWGVTGDIYLQRKLSGGRSGAFVYTADLTSSEYTGQAILKFDTIEEKDQSEEKEFERHQRAIEAEPDYAAKHIQKLVHATFQGDKVALISTIAGGGVEYVVPWLDCPFDRQVSVVRDLSSGLLERWNRRYALSAGLRTPQELLKGWLQHRIEPKTSRLYGFLPDVCGIAPDEPSFTFDGKWYPNPMAFAIAPVSLPGEATLRAVTGSSHGDLHGNNVLVLDWPSEEASYSLIDLAMYEPNQYLFYDHAYFEIAHLLATRDTSDPVYWATIQENLRRHHPTGLRNELRADDLGLAEIIGTMRGEIYSWIDRHEPNRQSYMESQYLLARVGAGLNFANKRLDPGHRRLAFLYAAFNLKLCLRHLDLDWPKYGPLLRSEPVSPSDGQASSSTGVRPTPRRSAEPSGQNLAAREDSPPLPEHPSIAVLPFEYLGADDERDFIADGVSLEVITELSRVDWLTVIARSSSFIYKGKPVDPVTVGRELGVHYLVDGTVRANGDRLRVTAELLDASDGHDIWTQRYDGTADDIFAVLDEIAESVVANIDTQLKRHQRQLAKRKRSSYSAWELYQQAMALFMRRTKQDSETARQHLVRALGIDPNFAAALAALSMLELRSLFLVPGQSPDEVLGRALELARRAVESDEGSSIARSALGRVYSMMGMHEKALVEAHEAVELNPSFSLGYLQLASVLIWAGRAAEALQAANKSTHLSPKDQFSRMRAFVTGLCNYFLDEDETALEFFRRSQPGHFIAPLAFLFAAFIHCRQGREEEAARDLANAHKVRPDLDWQLFKVNFRAIVPDFWQKLEEDSKRIGFFEA